MGGEKHYYEEFKVSGGNLTDKVRELIEKGNVRRIVIKNSHGRTLLEIPLNAGLTATAVGAVFAPTLVAVGALAGLLTQVTVGVERAEPESAPVVEVDPEDYGDSAGL